MATHDLLRAERIGFGTVVVMVLDGLFALLFVVGSVLRRRVRHSVRCGAYGALGGVLDKPMAGF
ncbi:hypothetical protein [Streptomyces sp. NPDC092952]|uniref:hypothetical protein n=1 Tax=Streptomyces sp. NPDC092952 TaxID=3366018 RepID=UPI0037FCCCF7